MERLQDWWMWNGATARDVIERGIKTAVQTAAAAGLMGYAFGGDWAGFKTVLLSAVAAGVSVVMNAVVAWARS